MFQSSKQRMRVLLDIVDDMLVGAPEPDDLVPDDLEPAPHPHRRPVQLRVSRRGGAVDPRPMHCLCPERSATAPVEPARDVVER